MADDDPRELENYKANLRRQEMGWQARFDYVLFSDRAAVDIGLVALRTAILMNAGAAVALLAFVGQLWDDGNATMSKVLIGIVPFLAGLVCGALAALVAYFYQSFVTAEAQEKLNEVSQQAGDQNGWGKRWNLLPNGKKWTRAAMLLFGIASLLFFVFGAGRLI